MNLDINRRWVVAGLISLIPIYTSLPAEAVPAPLRLPNVEVSLRAKETEIKNTRKQAALATYIAGTYRKTLSYAQSIVRLTFQIAEARALPPSLLLAMMAKESGFEHSIVNSYGATGLMQIVPRFHLSRLEGGETLKSFSSPPTNIRVAADILVEYLSHEGSLEKALKKYSGNAPNYTQVVSVHWRKLEAVQQLTPA